MPRRPLLFAAALLVPLLGPPARALELTRLQDRPLRLDITAATSSAWHADNRNSLVYDDDYGDLYNRVNLQLSYWRLTGGLRLDTATYAGAPDAAALARQTARDPADPAEVNALQSRYWERLRGRHRDVYTVGKAWLSYASPALDLTAGDAYVSFGRGLALSLRKQDELAVDTTLLGGKVSARSTYANATLVAGVANPSRVDEASAQSLYPLDPDAAEYAANQPGPAVYGRDAIFGARAELTALGAALGVHGVRLLRADTLGQHSGVRGADTVDIGGASLQVPLPRSFGSAYLEGALQRYQGTDAGVAFSGSGSALYGSLQGGAGPVTGMVELQHYRDFDGLPASVDLNHADAFLYLRYNAAPTTEPLTTDTRFMYFDRCVTGGRARVDGRLNADLLLYGTYGHWASWGERTDACLDDPATARRNDVDDGSLGLEWRFDRQVSHVFLSSGVRHDRQAEDGRLSYREFHVEGSVAKAVAGPWSLELDGRHRRRFYIVENLVVAAGRHLPWSEGEFYLSAKYAPSLVVALGFEYTGLEGLAPTYFNGLVGWKYRPDASLRLFAGQQRGALKCVSGVCRQFPPFEGVKLEWTQRY